MTAIFPTALYNGVAGANIDPAVEVGVGGAIAGTGLAKYDPYDGPSGMRAKYTGLGSNTVQLNRVGTFGAGAIIYITMMVEHFDSTSDGKPAVGFTFNRLDQNANNTTIASIGMGTAGALQLNGALDALVASAQLFKMTYGRYVLDWVVNTTTGQQTLDIFDYYKGYHIEQLSGTCGTGTVTRHREGIIAGSSVSTMYFDNVSIRNDYRQYDWYAKLPFVYNILPLPDRLDVTTQTRGCDMVRIYSPELGLSSDWQVPDPDVELSYHYLTGFNPDTRYQLIVQAVENNTGAIVNLQTISNKTAKSYDIDKAYTYKTGVIACTKTGSTISLPFTHAISRDLDNVWFGGDWFYNATEINDWKYLLRRLICQYNQVPGFRDVATYYGAFYTPSDHDFLANNGQTGGNPITLSFQAAYRRLFPQYANQFASEKNLSWAREVGNGILEIYWDFRNYERTDSDSVSVPYNSPLRAAFGPEFMNWFSDLMKGDWRYIICYSDPVWLSKMTAGVEGPLTAKTDAFASYTFTRDQISALMEDCNSRGVGGLLVTSDMHSVNCTAAVRNPHGHWNQVGAAATDQTLVYKGGDYDQYFPDRTLPGTTPLSVWGEIILSDNVGNIATEFNGWDCLTNPGVPTRQVHLTDTHATFESRAVSGEDWVTIHCFWRGQNIDGSPATGKLRIRPDVDRFIDPGGSGSQSLGIFGMTQELDIQKAYLPFVNESGTTIWKWVGAVDVYLPPTDDVDILGTPFLYICEEVLGDGAKGSTYTFAVPSDAASTGVDIISGATGGGGPVGSGELMTPRWSEV